MLSEEPDEEEDVSSSLLAFERVSEEVLSSDLTELRLGEDGEAVMTEDDETDELLRVLEALELREWLLPEAAAIALKAETPCQPLFNIEN